MSAPTNPIPYCGIAPVPEQLIGRWNLDPSLIAFIALVTAACLLLLPDAATPRQRRFAAAAVLLLLLLFVSPFCALTSALFSARALHHVLLCAVAAPLLAASLPDRMLQAHTPLAAATVVQTFALWLWHAPSLYAWALSSDLVYWLMQGALFASSLAFWNAIRRASPPAAVAALLAMMVQMGLLGALITFSAAPLYAPHLLTTQPWGLLPLEDQQLAGLIMWGPASGIYLAAALMLAGRWLGRQAEGRAL